MPFGSRGCNFPGNVKEFVPGLELTAQGWCAMQAGIHVDYVSRWHFGAHPSCDEMREWLVDHKETETDNEKDV